MANYKTGSVGSVATNQSSTTLTCTPGTSAAVGERIICCAGAYTSGGSSGTITVSDSINGAYAQDSGSATFADGTFPSTVAVFSVNATSSGTPTITITMASGWTGATVNNAIIGVALIAQSTPTSSPVDVHKEGTGTSGTASSTATPSTTGSNEYAVGFYYDDGNTLTLTGDNGAGWTERKTNASGIIECYLEDQGSIGSGTAITANLSSGHPGGTGITWAMIAVVYKDSGGAGPSPVTPPMRMLRGVGI